MHMAMVEVRFGHQVIELPQLLRIEGSQVLKGFWLQVDWLWQEELPDPMECLQVVLRKP